MPFEYVRVEAQRSEKKRVRKWRWGCIKKVCKESKQVQSQITESIMNRLIDFILEAMGASDSSAESRKVPGTVRIFRTTAYTQLDCFP